MAGVSNCDFLYRVGRRFGFRRIGAPERRGHDRIERTRDDSLWHTDWQHRSRRGVVKNVPRSAAFGAIQEIDHLWATARLRSLGAIVAEVADTGKADHSFDRQRIVAIKRTCLRQPSPRRGPQCEMSAGRVAYRNDIAEI